MPCFPGNLRQIRKLKRCRAPIPHTARPNMESKEAKVLYSLYSLEKVRFGVASSRSRAINSEKLIKRMLTVAPITLSTFTFPVLLCKKMSQTG